MSLLKGQKLLITCLNSSKRVQTCSNSSNLSKCVYIIYEWPLSFKFQPSTDLPGCIWQPFYHQLSSRSYQKICWKHRQIFVKAFFLQNILSTKIALNVRNNFCTQHVLPMFELGIFMYWNCNSMNNLSSYCGSVDAKRFTCTHLDTFTYFIEQTFIAGISHTHWSSYVLGRTRTIRKSSKMDGAKYIPNFAFKWW